MAEIHDRLDLASNDVADLNSRMDSFFCRFGTGGSPKSESVDPSPMPVAGMSGGVEVQLSILQTRINQLREYICQLNRIA